MENIIIGGGGTYSYTPVTITRTLHAQAAEENGNWRVSDNINISLTGENVDLSNAGIFVNGKEISHNYGKASHKVTENGSYRIVVTYPGLDDIVLNINISNIDKNKPTYSFITEMNPGSNYKYLTISGIDDKHLKSISVNGNNIYNYDNKKGYSIFNAKYVVKKTGDYKIRVEDIAGNYYENTEKIEIDTAAPKITNFIVGRDGDQFRGNPISTKDGKHCAAKLGSKITIWAETDEEIGGIERLCLNGRALDKSMYTYKLVDNNIWFYIELTKDIVELYRLDGYVNITFNNLKDKWGNKNDYSNNKCLYINIEKPHISDVVITGGTLSKSGDVIEIYQWQEINVSFLLDKHIFVKPEVCIIVPTETDIPGRIYDKLYTKTAFCVDKIIKDGKTFYKYTAELDCTNMIRQIKRFKGHMMLDIGGCYDDAGNISDLVIIDQNNKSSNGMSLVYGTVQTGEIYLAGVEKSNKKTTGDINSDGYINEYDYLLLSRHLNEKEEISEEDLILADLDGNEFVDKRDLDELKLLISRRENTITLNKETKFKAFNDDNQQIIDDNLSINIEEGNNIVQASYDNGIITIKTNEESGNIKIKTTYMENTGYEQKVGNCNFKVGNFKEVKGEFSVLSENKNNRIILGDLNNDGYVTLADSYILQLYLAEELELSDEQTIIADVLKDERLGVDDVSVIQSMSHYNYNGLKKGDNLKLKFNYQGMDFSDLKDEAINNQINWYAKQNSNMVTITQNNEDGTADIKVNNNAEDGSKITIVCEVKEDENYKIISEFNIVVIDNVEIELSETQISYDMSYLTENYKILRACTNISNMPINWSVSDKNVISLRTNMFGDIQVVPLKSGTAEITATIDGVSKKCVVNVKETIKNISVEKNHYDIEESEEIKFSVATDPISTTEEVVVSSEDENIARVYKDETLNTYKILGAKEGNTKIFIFSPSNNEIKQEIEVNVTPLEKPTIQKIIIDNEERIYKTGEELYIKIVFSESVKGEAPLLNIGFGGYASNVTCKFIQFEENNTVLVYKYIIQRGDNGNLEICNLKGGSLTDSTGKIDAKLTVNAEYIQDDNEMPAINIEEKKESKDGSSSNVDRLKTSNISYVKKLNTIRATSNEIIEENNDSDEESNMEFVSSGIYRSIGEINADTQKPTITIKSIIDKSSCWLKDGDIARIKITSNEELENIPTVLMGGINATVEGEGTEFIASIPITNEMEEGYLEIKVSQYRDLAGNEGEDFIAKDENIEEPIIIDNSETIVKEISLLKEKDKKYKEGDKFFIKVSFGDKTIDRIEYIKTENAPQLVMKFGDELAKGKLESNYIKNEYTDSILYTYTISAQDQGKISINSITGNVVDIAGNETDLGDNNILPTIQVRELDASTEENGSDINNSNEHNEKEKANDDNISNSNEENRQKLFGVLPYTGATIINIFVIIIGFAIMISGIIYIIKKKM